MSVARIATVAGARPVVELGVGNTNIPSGQAVWDTARWDTPADTWASNEPTWLDITCDVHDIEIDAGRDRSIARWQVGTASITLDNRAGAYDIAATPSTAAVLSIRPGRQLRVGIALDGGVPVWLGRWFIDGATPTYDPVLQDVVELACVDAKGAAGKVDIPSVAPPGVGALESVTERIGRVLDEAEWLPEYRALEPASTTLLATTLGLRAVDLMDVAADSGGGVVYGDRDGKVAFRNRDWQIYDPVDPVDDTIGNLPLIVEHIVEDGEHVVFLGDHLVWGTAAGGVCPSGWEMMFEADNMATRVLVGRPSEAPHVFNDLPNQLLYGLETFVKNDLICADAGMLDTLGNRMLRILSADFLPNVAAVTIDAATSTAARDLAASVDPTLPSRYRGYLEQGGRVVFDRQFFCVGVSHRIDPETWTVRIALDDAGPFAKVGNRWDDAAWSSGLWSEPAAEPLEEVTVG